MSGSFLRDPDASGLVLEGRRALVTGANSGVGLETARALARLGAHVTLAVRNPERGAQACRDILTTVPEARLHVAQLDLARFSDVVRMARETLASHERLDILVNNAGIHTAKRQVTVDGHELTFQTNHLSHHLLTRHLEPLLRRSAPSRVVTVASQAHLFGRMRWDDLEGTRWNGFDAYTQSKLANILFSNALAKRLEGTGVTSNAVHPGSVRTRWARGADSGLFRFGVALASPFLLSPEKGARTPVHVATAPELEGVTGHYFVRCREARPNAEARDPAAAQRLWDLTEAMLAEHLP